jgi:hypothetical protein
MLARLYSGLLDGRLRGGTRLSAHQRGLANKGCSHTNLTILSDGIKRAKRQGGGVVVAVDIANAIDTVLHVSIIACLYRQGLHPHAARLIGNM